MKFKLNGLHLFIILIGSFLLFSVLRPIMEGFNGEQQKELKETTKEIKEGLKESDQQISAGVPVAPALLQKSAGEQAIAADTPGLPQSFLPSFLQPKSETDITPAQAEIRGNFYVAPAGDTVLVDVKKTHPASMTNAPSAPMTTPSIPPQNSYGPNSGSLPMGIPKSQIPPGSEDLYILKSQVVPPVCPAVNISACPKQSPPPPCPPCGRCPEPSFECKKVPNYKSGAFGGSGGYEADGSYLPRPVLASFASFGM